MLIPLPLNNCLKFGGILNLQHQKRLTYIDLFEIITIMSGDLQHLIKNKHG